MKVLVATKQTQGEMPDDYFWGVEGELVTGVVAECRRGPECGCARGWSGLGSARAVTTAMVVDRPALSELDLRDAIRDALDRDGWFDVIQEIAELADDEGDWADPELTIREIVDEHVEVMAAVCDRFPSGTVVVRCGASVAPRRVLNAA